jgi:uncharacterized 2Fe-2S/4Fe-4S cluster protein (DUF4445 family)
VSAPVPVTFVPAEVTVWVAPGTTVAEASRRAGILVPAPCGGRGVCGSCGVRVVSGELAPPDPYEQAGLARAPLGVRLACRARVTAPLTVRPLISRGGTGTLATPSADGAPVVPLVAGVDLGTTSVAAMLIDGASGREMGRSAVLNRQQSFGADVLSRLSAALDGHAEELAQLAEQSVLDALVTAASSCGVSLGGVRRVVIAANSAMAALVARADVSGLATHPFVAPETGGALGGLGALREAIAPDADITLLPPIGGFVGGDALAGILGAGLLDEDAPTLLVDVGTNAEVVLAGAGALRVASVAAGPAFDGGGLACGGPAGQGAVEGVRFEAGAVELSVIGGGVPARLCGAGLVSAVAGLQRLGHVLPDGALTSTGPLGGRVARDSDGVVSLTLAEGPPPIHLSQLDIRALQLAKAAVQVGIRGVLRDAGLKASQLADVVVAGAFGSALEAEDLVTLGIVPGNAPRCRAVGNAALTGAAVLALSPELLGTVVGETGSARSLDLAADSGFNDAFVAATALEPFTA